MPALKLPKSVADSAPRAAAPFLGACGSSRLDGRDAISSDTAGGMWLLQNGAATWLVCSAEGSSGAGGKMEMGWRPAPPLNPHSHSTAVQPVSNRMDVVADSSQTEAPAAATTHSGTAAAAGGTLRCLWRVRLRDCVDASPVVVATSAAVSGNLQGETGLVCKQGCFVDAAQIHRSFRQRWDGGLSLAAACQRIRGSNAATET